jgi:hypothetical protein
VSAGARKDQPVQPPVLGAVVLAADQRMESAKALFSRAALAALRGAPDAAMQVQAALAAVDQARAELRKVSDDA